MSIRCTNYGQGFPNCEGTPDYYICIGDKYHVMCKTCYKFTNFVSQERIVSKEEFMVAEIMER